MANDNVKRESSKKRRKRLAIDCDGVLHTYSRKWHDGTLYDKPVEGSVEAIKQLAKHFDIVCFTCREPAEDVAEWLKKTYQLDIPVTNSKPHADMYIDDRGYHFDGSWDKVIEEICYREKDNFENWNHKGKGIVDTWS